MHLYSLVKVLSEPIEFDAVEEPWNTYKLKDGTILKTRFILIQVIMEGVDEAANPIYIFNSDTVVGAMVPKELIGEPSERVYTLEERVDAIEEELSFEVMQENWNEYKLHDGTTLKVKLALAKVARTRLHDKRGQPLYLVNTQPIFNAITPPELRQKLKEQRG